MFIFWRLIISSYTEEIRTREAFLSNHREQLPDDLCLCIDDVPTRYEIGLADGETQEEVPDVDADLLEDVSW